MKTIKLLAVLLLVGTFLSCSSEEELDCTTNCYYVDKIETTVVGKDHYDRKKNNYRQVYYVKNECTGDVKQINSVILGYYSSAYLHQNIQEGAVYCAFDNREFFNIF